MWMVLAFHICVLSKFHGIFIFLCENLFQWYVRYFYLCNVQAVVTLGCADFFLYVGPCMLPNLMYFNKLMFTMLYNLFCKLTPIERYAARVLESEVDLLSTGGHVFIEVWFLKAAVFEFPVFFFLIECLNAEWLSK